MPDPTLLNPVLLGAPVAVSLSLLGVLGWRRHKADEREVERQARIAAARISDGAAYICTEALPKKIRKELVGAFMLVGIGTPGLNQVARLLILLHQCGLEALVGSILIIENDTQLRARFHQRIPPVFYDRLVYGYSEAYSGGMSNKPIAQVLEKIDLWGVPIEAAAEEVIDRHLRRNDTRAPSDILVFTSQGGQGPLGLPVLGDIHERFEETQIVGFTMLPRHERLRRRFEDLKAAYEERGVFGWVLSDNLEPDPVTSDYGMVAMIVALADAALHADQATQPNNAFSLALTQEPGAVLVYQTFSTRVPGERFQPDPSMKPRYYVLRQPVVEQVLKGLRRIEEGRGLWSAQLPIGEAETSTFDMVMASIFPDGLRRVEDAVTAGRKLRAKTLSHEGRIPEEALVFPRPNYETAFASIATEIDPEGPSCLVLIVRLTAVRDGAHIVDEIVKVPYARYLPGYQMPMVFTGDRGDEEARILGFRTGDPDRESGKEEAI